MLEYVIISKNLSIEHDAISSDKQRPPRNVEFAIENQWRTSLRNIYRAMLHIFDKSAYMLLDYVHNFTILLEISHL